MFSRLFNKFTSLGHSHQLFFAALTSFAFITFVWSTEKLLETYLFPNNPIMGYWIATIGSLVLLGFIYHFILHVL